MAYSLRLDNWAVKKALRHPLLDGKQMLARGAFATVFEGTRKNTVLKMTLDNFSYWMSNDYAIGVTHRMFPRVVDNHREIGDVNIGGQNFPIYLYEVERLEKLQNGSQAKKTARLISNAARSASNLIAWKTPYDDRAVMTLEKLVMEKSLSTSVKNAIKQLCDFCYNMPGALLDMHMGNFMQRRNGELVITDPLASALILNKTGEQLNRRGW